MISDKIKNIRPKIVILLTFVVYVVFWPLPFAGYFVFGTFPSSIHLSHTISPFFLRNYNVPSALGVTGVSLGILLVDLILALITYKIFKYKTVYLASALILLGTFFPIYVSWSAKIEFASLPDLAVMELKNTKSGILRNNKGPLGTELEIAKIEEIEINITPKRIEGGDIYYVTLDRQGTRNSTFFTYCHLDRSTPPDIKNGECYLVSEIELFDKMSEVLNVTTGKNLDPQVTCLTEMPEKTDCPEDDTLFEKEPHPYGALVPLIDKVLPDDDKKKQSSFKGISLPWTTTKVAEDEVVKVRSISKNDIARPIGGNGYSITVEGQSSGADAYLSYCHMDRTEIFDIKIGDCFYLGPLSWQEEKLSTKIPWEYISTGKTVTLPGCFTEKFEKIDCPGMLNFLR